MSSSNADPAANRRPLPKSTVAIGLVVIAGLYGLLRPSLNEHLGLDLPSITAATTETDRERSDSETVVTAKPSKTASGVQNSDNAQTGNTEQKQKTGESESPPDRSAESSSTSAKTGTEANDSSQLLHGLLKEVAPKIYLSPAGLVYGPGSREGHRLEHLRRHTKDDPGRPGSHGVFDGGMEGMLKTVDRAYEYAKKGQRTTKKQDRDRTIYTIDMGKRVGYVGGREGGRRRKPMARRVTIVLEGKKVITAYPK